MLEPLRKTVYSFLQPRDCLGIAAQHGTNHDKPIVIQRYESRM